MLERFYVWIVCILIQIVIQIPVALNIGSKSWLWSIFYI